MYVITLQNHRRAGSWRNGRGMGSRGHRTATPGRAQVPLQPARARLGGPGTFDDALIEGRERDFGEESENVDGH